LLTHIKGQKDLKKEKLFVGVYPDRRNWLRWLHHKALTLETNTNKTVSSSIIPKDVIIIGSGASGLMCAIECGKRGRSVQVLDHGERTGSKIRISGGGRCNFTNLNMSADHYLSQNPHFCRSALARFSPLDILTIAGKYHIDFYEKEAGQIFCVKSSREIIAMLEQECNKVGTGILLKCNVTNVAKRRNFLVETSRGAFCSNSLVIATGGLSYANLGASGFGHDIARQFGLKMTQVRPALAPFVFSGKDRQIFRNLAGVSFDAALSCNSRVLRGSILFTHRGLSGPAALQASLYWAPGLALTIDVLPATDILKIIVSRRNSRMMLHKLLSEFLPKRFAQTWCSLLPDLKPINETSDRELKKFADRLHAWKIVPKGMEGYELAEVTVGGVNTDELSSKTMESKKVPGLYFIGEVVDVTGELGGYNLHWAWASGYAAGQFA
jgi:predicted Rossmann fold flavoprotein